MSGNSRGFLGKLDFGLLISVFILLIFGIIGIASATHFQFSGTEEQTWYVYRQGLFILCSLLFLWFSLQIDYRILKEIWPAFYVFSIILLVAVAFFGHTALGAKRWLQLGPLTIQPSEIAKILIIISLAAFLEKRMNRLDGWFDLLPTFALVGIPVLLVLKQPDLGTALVFLGILGGVLFVSGLPLRILYTLAVGALLAVPMSWPFLHDYQKSRVLVLINPNEDPLGAGYHVIQSQIAIGSGQFLGKGLFSGSQSQLNFLPENHTDFIFSVIGEELGFVGSILLVLVYGYLLYRTLQIALAAQDDFGLLLAVGIASMWLFQLLVNVGMTMGIMPVTGLPLPFVSYGLSSLMTNILSVAILLNIHVRRKKISF